MLNISTPNPQKAENIKRSYHFRNLILTLSFLLFTFLFFGCITTFDNNFLCKSFTTELFLGFIFCYALYWFECFQSGSRKYLTNDMEILECESYIKRLKNTAPLLCTQIECYRYINPSKETENYKDSEGKERTRPKTYDSRKVSFTASSYFNYKSWEDNTGEVVGIAEKNIIRLEVGTSYAFGDQESEKKFEVHRENYIGSNKHKDELLDEKTVLELTGYKSHVLVKKEGASSPCCLGVGWYWIWSFFLLSWPYRMWFESAVDTKRIVVKKIIYADIDEEKTL